MPQLMPRFEVHPVDEELTRTILTPNKETGGFDKKVVKEERKCFDVFFPNGHSMRVRGEDELRRLGFDTSPALVDMETGDIAPQAATSLKTHVERTTKLSRPKKDVTDG